MTTRTKARRPAMVAEPKRLTQRQCYERWGEGELFSVMEATVKA